jgi:hypothetical protein
MPVLLVAQQQVLCELVFHFQGVAAQVGSHERRECLEIALAESCIVDLGAFCGPSRHLLDGVSLFDLGVASHRAGLPPRRRKESYG